LEQETDILVGSVVGDTAKARKEREGSALVPEDFERLDEVLLQTKAR